MLSSQIGVEKSHENERRAQRSDSFAFYDSTERTQCGENPLCSPKSNLLDFILYTRREASALIEHGEVIPCGTTGISWNLATGRREFPRGGDARDSARWHITVDDAFQDAAGSPAPTASCDTLAKSQPTFISFYLRLSMKTTSSDF